MAAAQSPSASGLDSSAFVPFTLQSRTKHNHNVDHFVFALKNPEVTPNLPVSSCVMTRFKKEDGTDVIRPYTPINQHETGVLNLLIKYYDQGLMSKHIHSLKVGDQLEIKGPMAKMPYVANKWKEIGMIAGGTGLTPMLQVLDEIASNPEDKTRVTLLTANTSSRDVLLREKLDGYKAARPDQFTIVYVINEREPGVDWTNEHGYISAEMLIKHMPKPHAGTLIYTCGPPPFMQLVSGDKNPDKTQGPLIGLLKDLGYESSMVCKQ